MNWKYLKKVNETCFVLDRRLTPEVRAMFVAMQSRAPAGGIRARYQQVVEAIAASTAPKLEAVSETNEPLTYEGRTCWPSYSDYGTGLFDMEFVDSKESEKVNFEDLRIGPEAAEKILTQYPLNTKVQEFFDKFVGSYGHSSVLELTGSPTVLTEGVSWYTAYLSFDSPLCSGQEMSTRAVWRRDWPMCLESEIPDYSNVVKTGETSSGTPGEVGYSVNASYDVPTKPHPLLKELHDAWLEVAAAEIEAWKVEFRKPCEGCCPELPDQETLDALGVPKGFVEGATEYASVGIVAKAQCTACNGTGKKYPNFDKEPFRPAFDRARWALPGTIATGFGHSGHLRERARVIRDGRSLAGRETGPQKVWDEISEAYAEALPGLAKYGLKEAQYTEVDAVYIPHHLQQGYVPDSRDVHLTVTVARRNWNDLPPRLKRKSYLDPTWNKLVRVNFDIRCSLAVARDWHRHRTAFPWTMRVVDGEDGIDIDHHYESDGKESRKLKLRTAEIYRQLIAEGKPYLAMLALPLGTRVCMSASAGLRDFLYMMELRGYAHGANFEYREQARTALDLLKRSLEMNGVPTEPLGLHLEIE